MSIIACGCTRCRQVRRTAYLKAGGKGFEVGRIVCRVCGDKPCTHGAVCTKGPTL